MSLFKRNPNLLAAALVSAATNLFTDLMTCEAEAASHA
jgi:hypothetical protein